VKFCWQHLNWTGDVHIMLSGGYCSDESPVCELQFISVQLMRCERCLAYITCIHTQSADGLPLSSMLLKSRRNVLKCMESMTLLTPWPCVQTNFLRDTYWIAVLSVKYAVSLWSRISIVTCFPFSYNNTACFYYEFWWIKDAYNATTICPFVCVTN